MVEEERRESSFAKATEGREEKWPAAADTVIASMADGVAMLDKDLVITHWNPALERLSGYKAEEMIGKRIEDFFGKMFPPETAKKLLEARKIATETGICPPTEVTARTKKGELKLGTFSEAWIKSPTGERLGLIVVIKDITELKRLMEKEKAADKEKARESERAKKNLEKKVRERARELERAKIETEDLLTELDEAYKELKRTQEELVRREKLSAAGGLAAGVAHEIRNPLSIIGMSVQYLHTKFKEDDPRREFTEAIIDKVEKLDRVTKELIDYARPRKLDLKRRDIRKILDRVLRLSEHKCDAQKIKIVKRYAKSMPRISVDDDLMEQVFLNLISNALWAMSKGGELKISTRIHTNKDTKQHEVEIRFTDTGCGIPEKEISKIFDPFFTTRSDGSGLGLSIAQRIIEDHKGSIDVESEVKNGTTFTIRLPLSR